MADLGDQVVVGEHSSITRDLGNGFLQRLDLIRPGKIATKESLGMGLRKPCPT